MSPRARQTVIPFRAKKKVTGSSKAKEISDVSSDVVSKTPRRSMRRNGVSLLELTPSSALATLDINSPVSRSRSRKADNTEKVVGTLMPCRETELSELEEYLSGNLLEETPGSMYISGAPGTGKTAALTHVLQNQNICNGYQTVFVNCTAVKSSSFIYLRIAGELGIKTKSRTEKSAVTSIENFITRRRNSRGRKMILLVLDEIDQLESKAQTVLYRIFEWPSLPHSRLVLIGIANAVDLTDRVLPRLQALSMQPRLLHFRPYTKEQIVTILRHRMTETDSADLFAPGALELLSAKVASISGDLRRALDLGRRAVELSKPLPKTTPKKRALSINDQSPNETPKKTPRKQEKENTNLEVRKSPRTFSSPRTENTPCKEIPFTSPIKTSGKKTPRKSLFSDICSKSPLKAIITSPRRSPRKHLFPEAVSVTKSPRKDSIHASDVMSVVKLMYGSARNLRTEESAFPLHQKLVISTLLLILTKGKNKDISIGKLHDVYGRVCSKRSITAVDQSAFISLCRQVEMAGGVEIGKGPAKLAKISLQWDETEVSHALQDSSLLTGILSDSSVLTKK